MAEGVVAEVGEVQQRNLRELFTQVRANRSVMVKLDEELGF